LKLVRTCLRCTMGYEFLRDCLVLYTEKELSTSISNNEMIEACDLASGR
jgi:hypothetical protein